MISVFLKALELFKAFKGIREIKPEVPKQFIQDDLEGKSREELIKTGSKWDTGSRSKRLRNDRANQPRASKTTRTRD